MERTLPHQILHFVLAEKIAESRTGEVYKAWDSLLERFLAIKVVRGDLMVHKVFKAQVLGALRELANTDHPNICSFYGLHKVDIPGVSVEEGGSEREQYLIAMELVAGESLRERLRRGPLEMETFLKVATGVAAALNHAHQRGIVHGNLTPNNILIREDGEVRVIGFGFSTLVIEREAGFERTAETVRYRAPEHVIGEEPGPLADLFSAGSIFYECLTGTPAFGGGSSEAVEEAILHQEPDIGRLLPDRKTPGDVVLVLKKLLAKKSSDRFQHAAELQITLTEIVSFEKGSSAREFFQVRPSSPRQYLMISLLAALLIILWLVVTTVNR